ncbi:hypothetical protein FACS189494_03140 [Spirochaetia bacterium]|nr:hypothetical protein FACS189494_03140 [Spirochaetia bacterium]
MNCFLCKGQLENKTSTFMVEIENSIVIIKNVPSQICSQCGEVSYTATIALQLEQIVEAIKPGIKLHTEISIINYTEQAA